MLRSWEYNFSTDWDLLTPLSESGTRAKLIDPALHARRWAEDLIGREEFEARNYDLKAVNRNAKLDDDLKETTEALARLRIK